MQIQRIIFKILQKKFFQFFIQNLLWVLGASKLSKNDHPLIERRDKSGTKGKIYYRISYSSS